MRDDALGAETPLGDHGEESPAVPRGVADREAQGELSLEHERVVQRVVRLEVGADDGDDAAPSGKAEGSIQRPGRAGRLDDDVCTLTVRRSSERRSDLRRLERAGTET